MRQPLDKTQRNQLERAVIRARELVEKSAKEALIRLGVEDTEAPKYLNDEQRKLRNRLRAHARQLGDKLENGHQETKRLIGEVGYEHWHRMLFACFLEQNGLLMYDQYTAVTLEECNELADEDDHYKNEWELAAELAQKMLPQIFRTESPVFEIKFSTDQLRELEDLILSLPSEVFQAQDSLGWCYQFWQSKRKDEVNAAGVAIGADELSPVTQLFTEPYMVSFLLDNSLGAWWAKRQLQDADLRTAGNEKTLREAAAMPGVPLEYLRFVKVTDEQGEVWQPASGWFEAWPTEIAKLKTLDPCCGSGHFMVALFLMLVPMRMQLEGLDANTAVDKVITENLHGLELDSRCVEIAAFALALEAWRFPGAGGYRALPTMNVACSGLDVNAASAEWRDLAKQNPEISGALDWLKRTFKDAPVLGSLIDVNSAYYEGKNEGKPTPWQVLLDAKSVKDDASQQTQVTAKGLAMAAKLLAGSYSLVATNVPYLARGRQGGFLRNYGDEYYPEAKADLATIFLDRCLEFAPKGGTSTIVLPQNWLFLNSYKKFREKLLNNDTWHWVIRLGAGAFETISGEVVKATLLAISSGKNIINPVVQGFDVSNTQREAKPLELNRSEFCTTTQNELIANPDSRIAFDLAQGELLEKYAPGLNGMHAGDSPRYRVLFWELHTLGDWDYWQSTHHETAHYGGRQSLFFWPDNGKCHRENPKAYVKGESVWGKKGVVVKMMGELDVTLYSGSKFDISCTPIVPSDESLLPALWSYCESPEYSKDVRVIDQKMNVTNGTLVKVPFDLEHWRKVAQEKYPNGLPTPYTNDPTQWIFHGHPCGSVTWDEEKKWTTISSNKRIDDTVLHVATARLLGYRWPAELDKEMELAEEMRHWVAECDELLDEVDDDGIVCLPAIRGEQTAANRLEKMLQAAYGEEWSAKVQHDLLQSVGSKSLETWLRDKFFEQHCKLFQQRPFMWQIWDGLKDGFSVLVNYHKLDYKGLERLIFTYLGEWIGIQEHGVKEGIDGADNRLMAAKNLQKILEDIMKGEAITGKSGLDIFVRWKPLHEQPMGWNPDLNDGVRLNIRPFMQAPDVSVKHAGVLRKKPNIKWNKDRGTDVASAPWFHLGPEYDEKEGARINDHHVSLADKRKARENAGE